MTAKVWIGGVFVIRGQILISALRDIICENMRPI
jgi:hypothetical protein